MGLDKSQRKPILSVTKKDLKIDTFRAGGKGGQAQNKKSTGVRITHIASGAVGEARDSREQLDNKKAAFRRMIDTPVFQNWLRKETAKALGIEAKVDKEVERMMQQKNLLVEVKDDEGRWTEERPGEA